MFEKHQLQFYAKWGDNSGIKMFSLFLQASPVHGGSKERSYHSVQDFATADNISIAASVGGVSVGGTSTASTNVNSENAEELLRLYRNHTPDNDRPMYRQDILYSGSVHHLPQYTSNIGQ